MQYIIYTYKMGNEIKLMTMPYTGKVSITGNGHCVIIPTRIMEVLDLKHHDMLTVTITRVGLQRDDGRGNRRSQKEI